MVVIKERFGAAQLPKMELIDTKYANRMKQMKGGFSLDLIAVLQENFEQGKQSLLFQEVIRLIFNAKIVIGSHLVINAMLV